MENLKKGAVFALQFVIFTTSKAGKALPEFAFQILTHVVFQNLDYDKGHGKGERKAQRHEKEWLRAATCKYHLQLCKIEKSKIPKLCHNKGLRYLITQIPVSIHSRKYFSFAVTFPSRTLQGQANRLKITLLFAHCLEIIKY